MVVVESAQIATSESDVSLDGVSRGAMRPKIMQISSAQNSDRATNRTGNKDGTLLNASGVEMSMALSASLRKTTGMSLPIVIAPRAMIAVAARQSGQTLNSLIRMKLLTVGEPFLQALLVGMRAYEPTEAKEHIQTRVRRADLRTEKVRRVSLD